MLYLRNMLLFKTAFQATLDINLTQRKMLFTHFNMYDGCTYIFVSFKAKADHSNNKFYWNCIMRFLCSRETNRIKFNFLTMIYSTIPILIPGLAYRLSSPNSWVVQQARKLRQNDGYLYRKSQQYHIGMLVPVMRDKKVEVITDCLHSREISDWV